MVFQLEVHTPANVSLLIVCIRELWKNYLSTECWIGHYMLLYEYRMALELVQCFFVKYKHTWIMYKFDDYVTKQTDLLESFLHKHNLYIAEGYSYWYKNNRFWRKGRNPWIDSSLCVYSFCNIPKIITHTCITLMLSRVIFI